MKKEQYAAHASLGIKHWWHYGTKMSFLHQVHKALHKGAYILDAGCGVGDMMMLLKEEYRVVGIDSSEDAIKYCSKKNIGTNIIKGNISDMPFESESFDAIISLDVLYHDWVHDDLLALCEMHRILKTGGKIFIQLPAYDWLKSSHDVWACTSRRYTTKKLDDLFKASGFVKKKLSYRLCFLFPLAVVKRLFFKSTSSDMKEVNPIINSLLITLISFENSISLYLRIPFGLSVIGVAEKA